jgi:phenylacetate-CoA ligase
MNTFITFKHGLKKMAKDVLGRRYSREIAEAWDLDEDTFRRRQFRDLRSVLEYSLENVAYYRKARKDYGIPPEDAGSLSAYLQGLPIIDKETLRARNHEFFDRRIPGYITYSYTSGTTGTPLKCAISQWERAFYYKNLDEWYFRITDKSKPRVLKVTGMIHPSGGDRAYYVDRLHGDTYISSYDMKPENREAYISLIDKYRPMIIYGYPSSVYQLSSIIDGEFSHNREERVAVVTSEVLKPHWREHIERTLCAKVYNLYGSQESSHMVMECSYGRMHINPLIGMVEIVDDGGSTVDAGNPGRVVVTSLYKRSMPLIRYDLGDIAEYTDPGFMCPCGLEWPTMGRIKGRSGDLVKTRDGRLITLLDYFVFSHIDGIREAQIIQTGYESFLIKLVIDEGAAVSKKELEDNIKSRVALKLSVEVDIDFQYSGEIPRGPGGKFRPVIVDF